MFNSGTMSYGISTGTLGGKSYKKIRSKIGEAFIRRMKFDVAKDLPSIFPKNEKMHLQKMPSQQYKIYVDELMKIVELKSQSNQELQFCKGF